MMHDEIVTLGNMNVEKHKFNCLNLNETGLFQDSFFWSVHFFLPPRSIHITRRTYLT